MPSWYRNVDVKALVTEIKRSEAAHAAGTWEPMSPRMVEAYKPYMSRLYTLRAWMNGRLHITSAPEQIRDHIREMRRTGRPAQVSWTRLDRLMFNAEQAEFTARHFPLGVTAADEAAAAE